MILADDFFTILAYKEDEKGLFAGLVLNPEHIVYVGHFPGHPVTPGVIYLQMVNELLDKSLGKKMRLKNIQQCKFLQILNPKEMAEISIHIEMSPTAEFIRVKARGESSLGIHFKLQAEYLELLDFL